MTIIVSDRRATRVYIVQLLQHQPDLPAMRIIASLRDAGLSPSYGAAMQELYRAVRDGVVQRVGPPRSAYRLPDRPVQIVESPTMEDVITDYLAAHPGSTGRAITDGIRAKWPSCTNHLRQAVYSRLSRLCHLGLVTRSGKPGSYCYSLSEDMVP